MSLLEHYVTNVVETQVNDDETRVQYDVDCFGSERHIDKVFPNSYWGNLKEYIEKQGTNPRNIRKE